MARGKPLPTTWLRTKYPRSSQRPQRSLGLNARVGKVEFVAIRVYDDHQPVAPLPVLHLHAAPFQFRAQGVQNLRVERDEHQSLTHFVRPLRRQNELASYPRHLRHKRLSYILVAP